eukprot:gnl/Chilomastix_caulleri/1400.p1 GENE.gnl/Chilomastix_caulleri/1400~~gnl/Chilomastix_caulleri/1400.p1  ORF type:complete len:128 (+),score=11.57 gnl/Chilomastix_caulleri/1400:68-451(+)
MYRKQAGFSIKPFIVGMVTNRVMGKVMGFYFNDIVERQPRAFSLPKGFLTSESFISRFISSGIKNAKPGDVSYYFMMRFISPIIQRNIVSPLFKIPKQPSFFEKLTQMTSQVNQMMGNMPVPQNPPQ